MKIDGKSESDLAETSLEADAHEEMPEICSVLQHDAFTFAQLTVKVSAEIRFAAYGSSGEIVKGDPRKSMKTTDYWVLERSFVKAPSAKWRLASQINNVPAGQRKGLFQRMLF